MKKYLALCFFAMALVAALIKPSAARASEGFVELRNNNGEASRCWAASILMQNLQYQVLLSCRDIVYPGGTDIFNYVIWAMPLEGDRPFQLGTVGLGKVQMSTKTAFRSMFVTKEVSSKPKAPEGPVVMQGAVQRISILDNPSLTNLNEPELGQPVVTPTPEAVAKTPQESGGSTVLRLGGILGFIGLFGVILLILVITRK